MMKREKRTLKLKDKKLKSYWSSVITITNHWQSYFYLLITKEGKSLGQTQIWPKRKASLYIYIFVYVMVMYQRNIRNSPLHTDMAQKWEPNAKCQTNITQQSWNVDMEREIKKKRVKRLSLILYILSIYLFILKFHS